MLVSREDLRSFVNAAHKIGEYGLLRCSSGNMSFRFAEDIALVTVSGSWLGEITEDDIAVCRISSGEILNAKTPSVESRFHFGILQNSPHHNVVLHYQSPYATAISVSARRDWDFNIIGEIPYYIGEVGFVDYFLPGSPELAEAVIKAMQTNGLVLLRNHGQVTAGRDFADVIQKASFFELACQLLLTNAQVSPIPDHFVGVLKQMARDRRI